MGDDESGVIVLRRDFAANTSPIWSVMVVGVLSIVMAILGITRGDAVFLWVGPLFTVTVIVAALFEMLSEVHVDDDLLEVKVRLWKWAVNRQTVWCSGIVECVVSPDTARQGLQPAFIQLELASGLTIRLLASSGLDLERHRHWIKVINDRASGRR